MGNKVWKIVGLAALLLLAGGLAAFAAEEGPSATTGPGKGETTGSVEGPKITLRFPLMSPLFEGVPVAEVNGEAIMLKDLTASLASAHEEKKTGGTKEAGSVDYSDMLNRLITVQLIVQEAREMGMAELEEVRVAVKGNTRVTEEALLIEDLTKDAKVDEAAAEEFRKKMVMEWKVRSLLFEKEEDAKKMAEEIKGGKSFQELADKAMADKTAKGQGEGGYVKPKELLPAVAEAISKMEVGAVSPIIPVGGGKDGGFVMVKLEEIRYPDDPETMERARNAVLEAAKTNAVRKFKAEAYKKNVNVNNKLVNSLDFEAKKPGFEKMLKDKRTIVTVKGDRPVTVADLTKALSAKFFHGIDRAISEKNVNSQKYEVLDELLEKRLFEQETEKRGFRESGRFKRNMKEYEDTLLFGLFVKKVVIPDVKATEEDLKAYYDAHAGEYVTPEMMKVNGLAFQTPERSEEVLEQLRKGADFGWMKSNAEGQLDKSTPGLLSFVGTTVLTKNLPGGAQQALSGAKAGEYRLYKSPEDHYYVLFVLDVVPSGRQSYEEVRQEIAKEIFNTKLNALVQEWAGKLRETADVKIYITSTAAGEKAGKH